MRLFLVRHGAVAVERPGTFYGGTEVPLSEIGREEAQEAGSALREEPLQGIYASPLSRAVFGAEAIGAHFRGLTIQQDADFREIGRGRWVGLTKAELEDLHPGDLPGHTEDPWEWREHGGESLEDLRVRVLGARDRILRDQPEDATVVLVSHMFPTRAILADALGLDLLEWDSLKIPTGSISLVEYAGSRAAVRFLGQRKLP